MHKHARLGAGFGRGQPREGQTLRTVLAKSAGLGLNTGGRRTSPRGRVCYLGCAKNSEVRNSVLSEMKLSGHDDMRYAVSQRKNQSISHLTGNLNRTFVNVS